MENIEVLKEFFGWCLVINLVMLMFTSFILIVCGNPIKKIHSKMMGIEQKKLPEFYFSYLAKYKITILVFNLAPYVACCMM